ncbi:unnamed protein product [Durusdinium trenchii]|uniref:Uncharacterized protein n=2 Tax=Durusdinium trenchii TaxID=1381693 RepID=A0ABP0RQF3_9DINO
MATGCWYFLVILTRTGFAGTCDGDSCDQSSFIQRADRLRHLVAETCSVGDHVQCPGSDGVGCAGNQCCPGQPSFPCPSASPEFHGCGSPDKKSDCLAPSPSPSPTPPPTPATTTPPPSPTPSPSPDDGMITMHFVNREWADGVIFCIGDSSDLSGVYLDEAETKTVSGSSIDCTNPESAPAKTWGAGVQQAPPLPPKTTLCMGLKQSETIDLYLPDSSNWPSGTCWFQDADSNQKQSLSAGPQYQSQVEFTITNVVSWDLTSVEGVSGGITMNYTDADDDETDVVAIPAKFEGDRLSITPAPGAGFPTVLADKHRYGPCTCTSYSPTDPNCNNDACFTGCPGSLANNPCGQHRCRQWYAESYESDESYCGWLSSNKAQTYCWAMDEWTCNDPSCGYGAADQPNQNCVDVLDNPNVGERANVYSCGKDKDQPSNVEGVLWWTTGVGCKDKEVNGVPTNPQIPRNGGQIDISFENLAWLHEA